MSLRRAALTLAAVAASFAILAALATACGTGPQVGIVAAIIALGLMRRGRRVRAAELLAVPFVLAGVAIAAAGVGLLLRAVPIAGAVVFTAGLSLSLYVRRFGERGRRLGEVLALPLVAMLVVPPPPRAPGGPLVTLGLLVCAGFVPFAIAALLARFAPPSVDPPAAPTRARPGIAPTTRIALQLAVALAGAFAFGFWLFPGHWAWVVLTAFLVCSGSLGREHAVYFGLMRLLGAIAGTLAAGLGAALVVLHGPAVALVIFAVLFLGLWLRDRNYAFWAACITIVLALLAPVQGTASLAFLGVRLEAIVVGALCAVLATWLVYPLRTQDVLRLRLSELLVAIDELLVHGDDGGEGVDVKRARIADRWTELARVAPPMTLHHRLIARGDRSDHPAHWVSLARSIVEHTRGIEPGDARRRAANGSIRRAIGVSRRAIGAHGKPDPEGTAVPVRDALEALRRTFD